MADVVVKLNESVILENEVQEALVDDIEHLLAEAKSGRLVALAYAGKLKQNRVVSTWNSGPDDKIELFYSLEMLRLRMLLIDLEPEDLPQGEE